MVAALPVVAALMMQYIVFQHRLPWGRAAAISAGIAAVLAIGIALTLRRPPGLRLLRFVTLVPVVLGGGSGLAAGGPGPGRHALGASTGSGDQPGGQPVASPGDSAAVTRDRIWSPFLSQSENCALRSRRSSRRRTSVDHSGSVAEKYRKVDPRAASHLSGKPGGAGHGLLLGGGKAAISS